MMKVSLNGYIRRLQISYYKRNSSTYRKNNIEIQEGISIAYQEWGFNNQKKVLALHGWLDNSNSFSFLGPVLAESGYHVIAGDFVGHGHSSHLQRGYHNFLYLPYLRDFIDAIELKNDINVIGHSMGGAIGSCLAALYPEKFKTLTMLDSFGVWSRPAEIAVTSLKQTLEMERSLSSKIANRKNSGPKVYPNVKSAVEARIKTVSTFPGKQTLSVEAAQSLVSRGVYLINSPDITDDITDPNSGPVAFRHDKQILSPSYNFITNDVALTFLKSIQCPTLILLGEYGWPIGSNDIFESRVNVFKNDKNLLTLKKLPGSHHLHLDPNDANRTSNEILQFLHKNTT